MQRPTALTVIACGQLALAALHILVALPVSRLGGSYDLFGTLVSGETYMYWFLVMGVVWAYMAYVFFQGLALGLFVYLALKASHWGVTLLSMSVSKATLGAALLDAVVLFFVWKHRDWFRN
jgi:hypothetical protein